MFFRLKTTAIPRNDNIFFAFFYTYSIKSRKFFANKKGFAEIFLQTLLFLLFFYLVGDFFLVFFVLVFGRRFNKRNLVFAYLNGE